MPVLQQECHIPLSILSTTTEQKKKICPSPNDSPFLSLKANKHPQRDLSTTSSLNARYLPAKAKKSHSSFSTSHFLARLHYGTLLHVY